MLRYHTSHNPVGGTYADPYLWFACSFFSYPATDLYPDKDHRLVFTDSSIKDPIACDQITQSILFRDDLILSIVNVTRIVNVFVSFIPYSVLWFLDIDFLQGLCTFQRRLFRLLGGLLNGYVLT